MKMKFSIIEGSEKYRIVDQFTGDEGFTDNREDAYRYAGLFIAEGHPVRIESRSKDGRIEWASETDVRDIA
jgi:hypothetical protein